MDTSKIENFQKALKFAGQSFFQGCFSCLGAMVTTVIVLTIAGLLFGSIFGATIMQAVNNVAQSINTFLQNLQSIFQGNTGPFPIGDLSLPPTPTGTLPKLQLFLTQGDDSQATHLTTVPQNESPLITFWVKADQGVNTTVVLVLTRPDGSKSQFGSPLETNHDGSPLNCGRWATEAPAGDYQMDAYIGGTVVSEVTFSVSPRK